MRKKIYLFIIIVLIFVSGIILFLPIEDQKQKKDSKREENDMVDYEWYVWVKGNQMSQKPYSTDIFCKCGSYGLFFINTDQTKLYKTIDEGITLTKLKETGNNIYALWYEAPDLYFCWLEATGRLNASYLELDNSDNEQSLGNFDPNESRQESCDIWFYNNEPYVLFTYEDSGDADKCKLRISRYNAGWNIEATYNYGDGTNFIVASHVALVGEDAYFYAKRSGENVKLYFFDNSANTITEVYDFGANSSVSADIYKDFLSIIYDGSDNLFMVLYDSNESLHYLWKYNISGDIGTKLESWELSIQLQRFVDGTSGSPWEFPKAFHYKEDEVYTMSRTYDSFFKLQDLGLNIASVPDIRAISDIYLVDNDGYLWKYTEYSSKLSLCKGTYQINKLPRLKLRYNSPLSTDRIIEIYEKDSSSYIKCFSGKLGIPKFSNKKKIYKFKLENFGREDLTREIDDTSSAEDIATTAINQINDNSKYLYTDPTATPAIGVNNTNEWDDSKLKDNLYTLRILGNAFWYMDANGRVWFRKWSNKVIQSQHYFNKPDYFKKETVGVITSAGDNEWIDYLSISANCSVEITEIGGHKNVLKIYDNNAAGSVDIRHNLSLVADRVWEFYWRCDSTTAYDYLTMKFYEGGNGGTRILQLMFNFNNGGDIDYNGGAITTYTINIFHYIKVVCDDANNQFDFYKDGVNIGTYAYENNSTTGFDMIKLETRVTASGYTHYINAPSEPTDDDYSVGDNLKGAFHKTGDVGAPSPKRVQEQLNTWKIYAGWDASSNKPFEKEKTDAEHIQQYGPLKWKGRTQFTEAKTQAACDAIATALNNWQGMQDNPDDVIIPLMGYEFVGVGKSFIFTWDHYLGDTYLLSTTTTYIIAKNRVNFITGEQIITLSTNIVSRGVSI